MSPQPSDKVAAPAEKGPGASAKPRGGRRDLTALMHAAMKGYADIVEMLLRQGARVNARTDDGRTALMLAAGEGHAQAVRALLDGGADLHARDVQGTNALGFARKNGHADIVRMLEESDTAGNPSNG